MNKEVKFGYSPLLLAIESSCDDTSAAVLKGRQVLSNVVSSQLVHQNYGGIVPEVASRAHDEYIWSIVQTALEQAQVSARELDGIACTRGPGLLGSLLVGYSFAKGLAFTLNIPLLDVHHMKAHILAHFLSECPPEYPFICLTVSGGHTQLVLVRSPLHMEILGTTRDDAAGEAFDKAGKLLGLPYPAGPLIDKLARRGHPIFELSRANVEGLDFSFSGIKTSFLYLLREKIKEDPDFIQKNLNDLCASIQQRIVQTLLDKLRKACMQESIREVALAGGVAANSHLRKLLQEMAVKMAWKFHIPRLEYCTDNAAMIGIAGYFQFMEGQFASMESIPEARMPW